ncbi:MAG: DUF5666 domain-containing protein [Acidobacteria bacterium]|nr:DUF5666 domain-containing protein [Acidobacteriota bacterium]MCI0622836.1 DUF5666 domain-containing protein [Acidobacteriota bacterium]MCI0718773.1 DUF5666 domain-containing protein [Acidobacteriota bacterium]
MYKKLPVGLLFLALLIPSAARAHDPSKHKGKGVQGEIVSIENDRIELKTAAGAKTVTIKDKTKFERGSAQVTKSDLKKGDRVTVFGTKLANGELVAREILLGSPERHESQKEKATHKH